MYEKGFVQEDHQKLIIALVLDPSSNQSQSEVNKFCYYDKE